MKVVHVIRGNANPNTMNGVNKVVHNLAVEQKKLGHDVEVWGIVKSLDEPERSCSYKLILFKEQKLRFCLSKKMLVAIKKLENSEAVVHLHSVFLPELYAVSRKLKSNNVDWVLSPHSGYNPGSLKKNGFMKAIYIALFDKKMIVESKRIHAIGESEIEDIKAIYPMSEVVLIPNGQSLDDVEFSPQPTITPAEKPVFGFCGRLAKEHKGLDLLITAFAKYKHNNGAGVLWLIGNGPDAEFLKQQVARLSISEFVHFFGEKFTDEKLSIMSGIDVFLHTSRWEGMPMSVLEAAALGIPLLLSEGTNMGDHVRRFEVGLVLKENSVTCIEKALFEFSSMSDGQRAKMGGNAKNMIVAELNWEALALRFSGELYC